jgi:glycosyltransferase involved in cell wall biosynthesis
LRITFVLPFASLSGGIRVVAVYAKQLTALGHEVWVVSQPLKRPTLKQRVLTRVTGRNHGYKAKVQTPLLDFLGERFVILDRPRQVTAADVPDADAIFATWWATAADVAALPASKGRKFYLLQGYETFDYLPDNAVIASFRLPLKKVAVSDYVRTSVNAHCPDDMIDLVPNAVDLVQFNGPTRPKNKVLTVGFLFNTHHRKRISLAIDAIKLARQQYPTLKAEVFGAFAPDPAFDLPDWVTYQTAPPQDEIPQIYQRCDLWLFPTEEEGFGLPLLEAMACRTPVLATRAGAAPDLIDGRNGLLTDPDPTVFAADILKFAAMTDAEWQSFSDAAYRTAHRYSWADATAKLLQVIAADKDPDSAK